MSSRWRRRIKRAAELQKHGPRKLLPQSETLQQQSPIRVTIATPMMDMCHTAYVSALLNMFAYSMVNAPPGISVGFHQYGTSILPFSRQMLAVNALEMNATHVLWIDSDMAFPEDMLLRLLSHQKDIVAANCIARRPPHALTARYDSGEQVQTTHDSTGLEVVARVGFGVMLHTTDVLRAMPLPWFDFEWIPDKHVFRGEDFVFCEKARKAGFEIHIDHDVSKQVQHVGMFGFSPLQKAALTNNGEQRE